MHINFRLFSERLRRVLAGEEVTLPDAAKQPIQNLHAEVEIVTSWLSEFEDDISLLLFEKMAEEESHDPDLATVMDEINWFTYESEKVIDTFINSITQQKTQSSCSKDIFDALQGLQSRITDIKQRMQQLKHMDSKIIDLIKTSKAEAGISSSSKSRDTVGLDDRMEELLDLLIEGPPQLSVVAILDSIGLDKTAFAGEAYNSSYVKHYFDCHAWITEPYSNEYDADQILDIVIKFLMPSSRLSEIMDKNYEMKKIILHEYLMTKRYLIVIDDVWSIDMWDVIQEILPDNQNGSRVLITLTDIRIIISFQFEDGENMRLDLVPTGGPLRATYKGRPFLILYHGSISLEENIREAVETPLGLRYIKCLMLPFCLKPCFIYLSVFPAHQEISTRQLYQLWIAEGFIPDNSEATAESYLEQLIKEGFVEAKKRKAGGTINTCSIPGRWRPVLHTVPYMVEFICSPFMDPKGKSPKKAKRLNAVEREGDFACLDDYDSQLHSLLCCSPETRHLDPIDWEKFCGMFKLLRVLDLGSLVLIQYPSGIENLFLLRYLKLNIPSLNSLPSSLLSNLLNLYTLDMPFSYIDHTADEFWKMNKLRHLNFGSITLPAHPGKFCGSLENLNFISALHPCCCTEDILGRLPNLRNLRIRGDLSYNQSLLSKSLCRLSCLESLKLANESKMPRLSKIVLAEYLFPHSLTHLSFSNTDLMDDPMPTLEKLPLLQVLKLKQNSYSGRKLTCGSYGFPNLKVLHLKSMLWLEEWTMGNAAMPKLECLIINPCAYLKKMPEQLWYIKSLNKFDCWWPQPELRQKLREFEDKEQCGIQLYPYGI
ncbi:Disease resistance protein RPM1 [Citrus sinensis]|uniref:probable disease resistance protein At1g58390 isoform X1 n=1 Tax=Citrus sinensis TaxID=2711 RepID=UPI00219DFA7F|nr:probable disease resistance protein At1g58390 isoform X1 [Citrus sinensis]KAH9763996.1 Disease resistance protein RPM1 [Citrus sinensis]